MPQLNQFQMRCQTALENLARDKGLVCTQAFLPDVLDPDELQIQMSIGEYLFCIYPDGADVGGHGRDERFEIYDYQSLDDLEAKYMRVSVDLVSRI